MALPSESLLSSPPTMRKTSRPIWQTILAILFTLSFVALIALTVLFPTRQLDQLQPSDLCTRSPNPRSCIAIVSDALLRSPRQSTFRVFHTILDQSRVGLDAAISTAETLRREMINEPRQQSALADCLYLMDLSRDHLATAADAASPTDARTWLSAVLTNHVTCRDGLNGPALLAMDAHLQDLMSGASASLAVLNALSASSMDDEAIKPILQFPSWLSHHDRKLLEASSPIMSGASASLAVLNALSASSMDDEAIKPILQFPSWLSHHDRKLLEASSPNPNVVVAQDGTGKYMTVQAAVDSAPDNGNARYVIYVKKGVYNETVRIGKTKTNLMISGDGMDSTVITGSLNYVDGTTTFNSATLAAAGTGLILQDLKIENTAGAVKQQAVALRVSADQSVINRCRIDGYQDTLYAHTLRQFYRDSSISGTVDFIFGDAAVVFQNCDLIARKPGSGQKNMVTAQGRTDPNENTGTSIQNCRVVPAPDLTPVIGSIPTYLGRPWKEYSRTVVMQSYIDSHVDPKGWFPWDGEFALKTLFYGEYMNKGPGAGTSGRVTWPGYKVITDANTANAYTVASLIQGGSWLKNTGVAFTEGL